MSNSSGISVPTLISQTAHLNSANPNGAYVQMEAPMPLFAQTPSAFPPNWLDAPKGLDSMSTVNGSSVPNFVSQAVHPNSAFRRAKLKMGPFSVVTVNIGGSRDAFDWLCTLSADVILVHERKMDL